MYIIINNFHIFIIKINLYWEVLTKNLNQEPTDGIEKEQFLQVANLLNVYVVEDSSAKNWFAENVSEMYSSKPSRIIQFCVKHRLVLVVRIGIVFFGIFICHIDFARHIDCYHCDNVH